MPIRALRVAVRLDSAACPIDVYKAAINSHRHNQSKKLPPWVGAMRLVPPAQPRPRISHFMNKDVRPLAMLDFEKALSQNALSRYNSECPTENCMFDSNEYARDLPGRERRIHPSVRPAELHFPEDALRERFYADHPFELIRSPPSLAEAADPLIAVASKLPLTRCLESCTDVTGEDVVMRQLYLVSKGSTVDDAYKTVLDEFYDVRAQQEAALRAKKHAQTTSQYGGNMNFLTQSAVTHPQNHSAWITEEKQIEKAQGLSEIKESFPSATGILFET